MYLLPGLSFFSSAHSLNLPSLLILFLSRHLSPHNSLSLSSPTTLSPLNPFLHHPYPYLSPSLHLPFPSPSILLFFHSFSSSSHLPISPFLPSHQPLSSPASLSLFLPSALALFPFSFSLFLFHSLLHFLYCSSFSYLSLSLLFSLYLSSSPSFFQSIAW